MFDNIKTIIAGFSGKLKEAPTLRKWFWVFVAAQLFTLIVLWYNSFMSLNFYQKMLERFADMQGDFLPYLVTISIALIAYFLISSITATVLDYIAGRKYKTEGHEPMFISAIIGLIALLFLDIYANLQGVDFVAVDTTTEVMANPLDNLGAEFEARRKNAEEAYLPRIQKLEGQIDQIKDTRKASEPGHNKVCKSVCPYKKGTGAVHWNGVVTPFGHKLIESFHQKIEGLEQEYNAELAAIRQEQAHKTEAAKDDYTRDKSRFDLAVGDKQSGHRKLVYFAYALAIMLSFVSNHYSDRALFVIYPDKEAELIAAFETRDERLKSLKAAQRAKFQYGNEHTQQLMHEILSQMNQQSQGIEEERKIGFRHNPVSPKSHRRTGAPVREDREEKLLRIWEEIEERLKKLEQEKSDQHTAQSNDHSEQKFSNSIDQKTVQRSVQKSPGFVDSEYLFQKEIELNSGHPKYTRKVQPDIYRGIDQRKYRKFVRIAKKVLGEKGTYNKTLIAKKVPMSRTTVNRYLNVAFEKGDLIA